MYSQIPTAAPSAASMATESAPPSGRLIADRGEFIDVLRHLRQGHVLVRPKAACDSDQANSVLDGCPVYTAVQPLMQFDLIAEFDNPDGFPTMRYFRMTRTGRDFADRALQAWRQRPWTERLAIRLMG
jgi:hypothetical protein